MTGGTLGATRWHALVIGVDNYPLWEPRAQLNGSVNDAAAMHEFLVERVGVDESQVHTLIAPRDSCLMPEPYTLATAANIRAAMQRLRDPSVVTRGDHVVLFLAGHGLRLRRGPEAYYGFAPTDTGPESASFVNLILDQEINELLSVLSHVIGAQVTVIADTCYSGSATRGIEPSIGPDQRLRTRGIDVLINSFDEGWARAIRSHPALAGEAIRATAMQGAKRAGGVQHAGWVILSACHDTETAKETSTTVIDGCGTAREMTRGVLSAALFDVLARIPVGALGRTRWMDIMDDIRTEVANRLHTMRLQSPRLSPQRPILEGRAEAVLFGGIWTPFAPGFAVRVTPGGALAVNGGLIHGLEEGAELAIFEPDTVDFEEAERRGVNPVMARVTDATAATSNATLLHRTASIAVKDGARAKLARPGPRARRIDVRLVDVPASIRDAALAVEGAERFFHFVRPEDAAHIEVRPWSDEWAILASDDHGEPAPPRRPVSFADAESNIAIAALAEPPFASEDVIARLPRSHGREVIRCDDARLGHALGAALVHWARYLGVRERRSEEDSLKAALAVELRVGSCDPSSALGVVSDAIAPYRFPGPDGFREMFDGEWFKVDLEVLRSSLRLFVGIVACSDDGNVIPMWPPPGGNPTLAEGDRLHIGTDRIQPAFPELRSDQNASRYTIKVFAYTAPSGSPAIDLTGMGLHRTVQDIIDGVLERPKREFDVQRGALRAPSSVRPTWCVWTLRIVVRRVRAIPHA